MRATQTLVFLYSVTLVFAGSLFHNRIGGQMWQYSFQEGGVGATQVQDDVGSELSMGALVMNTAAAEYLPNSTGVRTLGSGGIAFKSERTSNALYSFLDAATQPNPATSDNTNFAIEWWMQGPLTTSVDAQVVFGFGNWGPSSVPKCDVLDITKSLSESFVLCYGSQYFLQTRSGAAGTTAAFPRLDNL
jgi:hypothetical protein